MPAMSDPDAIERILAFLSQFVSLDDAQRSAVHQVTRIARYRKGQLLVAEGDVARESWLVVEGCIGHRPTVTPPRTIRGSCARSDWASAGGAISTAGSIAITTIVVFLMSI